MISKNPEWSLSGVETAIKTGQRHFGFAQCPYIIGFAQCPYILGFHIFREMPALNYFYLAVFSFCRNTNTKVLFGAMSLK